MYMMIYLNTVIIIYTIYMYIYIYVCIHIHIYIIYTVIYSGNHLQPWGFLVQFTMAPLFVFSIDVLVGNCEILDDSL